MVFRTRKARNTRIGLAPLVCSSEIIGKKFRVFRAFRVRKKTLVRLVVKKEYPGLKNPCIPCVPCSKKKNVRVRKNAFALMPHPTKFRLNSAD